MIKSNHYASYELAFNDMKALTTANTPFKLAHRKDDGSIKIVVKAMLRKRTPRAKDSMSPYKFNYVDVTQDAFGASYIPSLLSVNDKKIVLK